jgi:hypothetical protein
MAKFNALKIYNRNHTKAPESDQKRHLIQLKSTQKNSNINECTILSQKRKEWYKSCEIYNKKANIE